MNSFSKNHTSKYWDNSDINWSGGWTDTIFQGWIFGLPGLMLLGSVFPSVKRMTHKIVSKAKKKLKR